MIIQIQTKFFGPGGGTEKYVSDISNGLAERGHDLIVLCRKSSYESNPSLQVKVVGSNIWPNKLADWFFFRKVRRLSSRFACDRTISAGHSPRSDLSICGGTRRGYLRAIGKKPGLPDRVKFSLERETWNNATRIVAHSALMKNELIGLYGMPEEKIVVLHPPVDAEDFYKYDPAERIKAREKYGINPGKTAFLFPSTGHFRKGLPLLSRYFEATRLPIELIVAGRPSRTHANVRHIGYINSLAEVYNAVDCTILASLYEPFGLVGIESILCGTPAVLPYSTGCTEVIKNGVFGFEPNDMDSLDGAIRAVLAMKHDAVPLGLSYDPSVGSHTDKLLELLA